LRSLLVAPRQPIVERRWMAKPRGSGASHPCSETSSSSRLAESRHEGGPRGRNHARGSPSCSRSNGVDLRMNEVGP
jgi:hypothetical protein